MSNKIILVTGGNRGIGLEICRQLAIMNHQVILGSRNIDKGLIAKNKLKGNVEVVKLDLTDKKDFRKIAIKLKNDYGKLDVLINNAAISIGNKGVLDADLDEVKHIMEVNFFGAWELSQALLPLLEKSDNGSIINISSGMGSINSLTGGYAGYRLSKTALNALTIQMSNELMGKVRVNAVSPGWVQTDMGGAGAPRSVKKGAETPVWLATENILETGKFFRDKQVISW